MIYTEAAKASQEFNTGPLSLIFWQRHEPILQSNEQNFAISSATHGVKTNTSSPRSSLSFYTQSLAIQLLHLHTYIQKVYTDTYTQIFRGFWGLAPVQKVSFVSQNHFNLLFLGPLKVTVDLRGPYFRKKVFFVQCIVKGGT